MRELDHPPIPTGNIRGRLAPTPSGYLHQGNLLNFILTYAIIRYQKGELHLRIDDLDSGRFRMEYLDDIFRTLDWLGLDYDKGPSGPDDFMKNYSQNLKKEYYYERLKPLQEKDLIFACNCTRTSIRAHSPTGNYPGICRHKGREFFPGETALRLKVNSPIAELRAMGDFVVWTKQDLPAYQLVSAIEDLDAGMNYIVRGEDLLSSAHAQQYLLQQLGQDFTPIQLFHPLKTDENGMKLSKSQDAEDIRSLREDPNGKSQIMRLFSTFFDLTECDNLDEILAQIPSLPIANFHFYQ